MMRRNQNKNRAWRISIRSCGILAAAAALLAVPIKSSIGCGGREYFGRGWDIYIEPGEDVTDLLIVEEGWAEPTSPSPEPDQLSQPVSSGYKSVAPSPRAGKGKKGLKESATKPASNAPLPTAEPPADEPRLRTLTISGPFGTEVSIERSIDGVDWEIAEVMFIDDEESILWTETNCEIDCEDYQYRCTGYCWTFENEDSWGAYDDWY